MRVSDAARVHHEQLAQHSASAIVWAGVLLLLLLLVGWCDPV
jgi:hypothetical protein